MLLKLEILKSGKSDVLLYVGEVPAKVDAVRLPALIILQVQAYERSIRRHLMYLICEVMI